ncbi:MAG: glycosyltransferase [Akkermansiaceae bacterium]|nr:glycosyltransferase [Akkermansiaceae bacterium]
MQTSVLSRLRQIYTHNRTLKNDIISWLLETEETFDVTIFPSTRLEHIWAIHWLQRCDKKKRLGKIIAILIDAPGSRQSDGTYRFAKSTLPFRCSLRAVARANKNKNIIFAAESDGIARQFQKFSGYHFDYLPHVTQISSEIIWRNRIAHESLLPLTFGTFGFTRYDKGLDVLHDAIKLLSGNDRNDFRFRLQWTGDYHLPCGRWIEKDPELMQDPKITYLPAFSDSTQYHEQLKAIDAIVLPYRQGFYQERMSRVAVDASLVGLPVVYPRGTWLEEFFSSYGAGVAFNSEDPRSLAAAMVILKENFHQLADKSRSLIHKTRADFSASAFFEKIGKLIR